MEKYEYFLDACIGLGNKHKLLLTKAAGDAEAVYRMKERTIRELLKGEKAELFLKHQRQWQVEKEYALLKEKEIRQVCLWSEDYPQRLREIADPPFALYIKGSLPRQERLAVAIIGARECSEYGSYVASELGRLLGRRGINVISGMARGIDGISQAAALEAGGNSFGVLGCGVDVCYPKSNQPLYEGLLEKGGVLSPYLPGTLPMPALFPPRNRIVSGLSDVLVVIEARQKSGTAITVELALEQGKDVYAVPGRLTDRLSDGCNRMLKDGAQIFLSPREFLEELTMRYGNRFSFAGKEKEEVSGKLSECSEQERAVYDVLDFYPAPVELLMQKIEQKGAAIGAEPSQVLIALMGLCIKGLAVQSGNGWFAKSR